MSLYSFSVKKPITILMITLVVLIVGIVSLTRIPLDLLPKIEIPIAAIQTSYRGVGPQEIEQLVTKPIERVVATVSNVKNVKSISFEESSLIIAEFNFGTNMDFASLEIREKVDLIKGYLPREVSNPMVVKVDPSSLPVMQLSFYGDEDLGKLENVVRDVIVPRVERIEGVASVNVAGGIEREVSVVVREGELEKYGLSIEMLTQIIGASNLNLPGGQIKSGNKELTIKTIGEFTSINEIKDLPITTSTGGVIHLRDVADVSLSEKKINSLSRINGADGLNISIQKQSDSNTVRVSEKIHKELDDILREYPNIKMVIVLDQAKYIKDSIRNVFINALIGAILAVIILYIFLRDFKTTFIISATIPVSIVATFILLYFSKITINIMTLGGIALGVGMLVDNSIVVLENIFRLHEEGLDGGIASVEGAREVSMAVTASTLTTISVFLPIVFVEGMTATIFRELALTVTFSLFISLMVSLTLIPMLSSRTLRKRKNLVRKDAFHTFYTKVESFYKKILNWALSHRGLAVTLAVLIFVGTIAPLFLIGGEFFPPIDEGVFMVNITLPEGSSFKDVKDVIGIMEEKISKIDEVETVFSTIGVGSLISTSSSGATSNKANISVILVPMKERNRTTQEVADEVRRLKEDVAGAIISVDATSELMGGLGGDPVNIVIKGDDLDTLRDIGEDFKAKVETVSGTREVKASLEEGVPEVKIFLDRDLASQYGLTTYQVANAIRASIEGVVASKYKYEGSEIDIVVKEERGQEETVQSIRTMPIRTALGTYIYLDEIGDVTIERGPINIHRENQSRVVTVTSQIIGRDMESVIVDIDELLNDYPLPHGYTYSFEGQHKQLVKAYNDLTVALILAVVFVFIILASQFESFMYPFIIILSIPLSFSGAALFLLLSGKHLSVPAIVGGIVLAGIVVNNAIVLVDYINTLRKGGMDRDIAVRTAGPVRLRPILMTTLTTVIGLLPLALRKGEGSEIQSPMAIAVIGGLILSTLLTLVLVPVLYVMFDNIKYKRKNKNDI